MPHTAAAPRLLPRWLCALLDDLRIPAGEVHRVRSDANHSNDIHELTLRDGRVLLVKVSRHEWGAHFFENAAAAAALIRSSCDVMVPRPLPVHVTADGRPAQAYWRIDLPTLAELWPVLPGQEREHALRSLGRLLSRLHGVQPPGWGPLTESSGPAQAAALERDLRYRLLPASFAHWPEGAVLLERLLGAIPSLAERRFPALVHGDLHLGNVLCRLHRGGVRCVGLLDLDEVAGGSPETDLAGLDVLHGPLFERAVAGEFLAAVRRGYGAFLDEHVIHFYRCVHLANQGFSSAFLGHHEHAAAIHAALVAGLQTLAGRLPRLPSLTRIPVAVGRR